MERRRSNAAFLMRPTVMMFGKIMRSKTPARFFACHVTKSEKQVTIT